jgi:hypothetical protein
MLRKNHPHKDQVQRLIPISGTVAPLLEPCREEVDPVVVGSSGRQPTGLLEDAPELVQEAVQEGSGRPHEVKGAQRDAKTADGERLGVD